MSISKLRPPIVSDPETKRVVEHVYGVLNEIINSVKRQSEAGAKETEGAIGDIRLSLEDKGQRFVEFRFADGWYRIPVGEFSLGLTPGTALPSGLARVIVSSNPPTETDDANGREGDLWFVET